MVTVSPIGSVIIQPVNWIASTGDKASFICIALSGPSNTYRWIRTGAVNLQSLAGSGEPFSIDTFLQNLTTYIIQNVLEFSLVVYEDHGVYRCVVTADMINNITVSNNATITGELTLLIS